MDNGEHDHDDSNGSDETGGARKRPRVIDKRVSARPAGEDSPTGDQTSGAPERAEPPGEAPARAETPEKPSGTDPSPDEGPGAGDAPPPGAPGSVWTPEQEAEAKRVAEEIARVHGRDWVVSMAMNLANVAGVKIDGGALEEASLAIDALAGIVKETGPRMGDAEQPLRQILSQLQMAYTQASGAIGGPPQP